MTSAERPSARLRNLRTELYRMQDNLDALGWAFVALGAPDAAGQAAKAGDAIEDLRHAVEADADRLADREATRDRRVALAAAGGASADAFDADGGEL